MQRCNALIPISRDGRATMYCTLEHGHEGLHGCQLPLALEWFDYDPARGLTANPQRFLEPKKNGDTPK